jgi:diaminohydroxyphosphoribosylaminopyrimidine deaminase/5-amino-6-(5-phosphoribosylamino)uracil reductase
MTPTSERPGPDTTGLSREDIAHLEWARQIARKGWGQVHPNPLVGCVVVRDGRIVGEGYHREFGGPHAEIVALEDAKGQAEGATAYVSLEPCNHEDKTPPCSSALIRAGVERVVYGASEPGRTEGGGGDALRSAGLEVTGPVWSPAVGRAENPAFFHRRSHDTPFIAVKLALSLDGRIAAEPGVRTRVTGPEAEAEVHRLRTGFDGILIGTTTAKVDDPQLTVRKTPEGRTQIRRLVLDASAELPSDAALFEAIDSSPLHVFTRRDAPETDITRLESLGAHVHPVPQAPGGLDLGAVLGVAWELGVLSLLCEGGGRLVGSLMREDRVQRLYLIVAPHVLGPKGVPAFGEDAEAIEWSRFSPAFPPELYGRDTMMILDRDAD